MMTVSYNYSKIWKVTYPIFLTLLVQNLIQVISTAFLGRVGEVELGASAVAGIYYIAIFMLAFGFSTGSQILIGRRNGEGNYHKIGEILINGIMFLLCMALGLFFLTNLFSKPVLSLLISSPNVLEASLEYLDWRIYGIFFSSINVMFRAFFVGTTNTKILSINALIMAVTNIIFDYLLIFGNFGFPKMGIAGAALSPVISEVLSVIFFIAYTYYFVDLEKYGFKKFKFSGLRIIKRMLNISLSLMIQNFLSLSTWFLFFVAIEHLGERELAISNIVRSVYMIACVPVFALAATANTLVSNTIGAGKSEKVMKLIWKIAKVGIGICTCIAIICLGFPKLVLYIYTSDTQLISDSIASLRVMAIVLPLIGMSNIYFSAVSGTGNTRTALVLEICTLAIYIFYIWYAIMHIQIPLPLCWTSEYVYATFIFMFSFIYLRKGAWRNKVI